MKLKSIHMGGKKKKKLGPNVQRAHVYMCKLHQNIQFSLKSRWTLWRVIKTETTTTISVVFLFCCQAKQISRWRKLSSTILIVNRLWLYCTTSLHAYPHEMAEHQSTHHLSWTPAVSPDSQSTSHWHPCCPLQHQCIPWQWPCISTYLFFSFSHLPSLSYSTPHLILWYLAQKSMFFVCLFFQILSRCSHLYG